MVSNFVFFWVSVCVCVSCAFSVFFLPVCFLEKEEGYVVGWVGRGARKVGEKKSWLEYVIWKNYFQKRKKKMNGRSFLFICMIED